MRQFLALERWQRMTVAFFVALAILAGFGAFGTYTQLDLVERIVFWSIALIGVAMPMQLCISTLIALPIGLPRAARIVLGAVLAALPGAAIVVFIDRIMRPPGMELSIEAFTGLWLQVSAIGILIGLFEFMPWATQSAQSPAKTPFHDRLPPALGSDIMSLTMQDHYVEVTTTQGKSLILIRMTDALSELTALPGQRLHRSHWAALAHIETLDRAGGRDVARLSDGRSLPVSQTYIGDVRSALAARSGISG